MLPPATAGAKAESAGADQVSDAPEAVIARQRKVDVAPSKVGFVGEVVEGR